MWGAIILNIISGLCFLIGIVILSNHKHQAVLEHMTIAIAFVVIIGLLLFDLMPEIIEYKNILLIIPIMVGLLTFILLDKFIPHHEHIHHQINDNKHEHLLHLDHIGIVTIIALIIHNLLEGITLYSVTINEFKSGLLMMLSISLHNIPLGFQIGNTIKKEKYSLLLILLLCSSPLVGGILILLFGQISNTLISILISLTFGMLLYITIFELFKEIKTYIKEKSTIYGIIIGVIILFITLLI